METKPTLDPDIYTDLKALRLLKYKAHGFDFLPNQPINSALTGRHVSKLRGRGLNFEEMRHYQIGDDIRTMDWKVTNRTGKPHVKIFSEERERNVYVMVDQRTSMFFGSTGRMKSVVAAEIAALIAWKVIDSTDRVGAIVYNDSTALPISPQRSANHVLKILNEIASKNQQLKAGKAQDTQSNSFAKLFHQAQRLVKHDGLVILITDGYGYNERSEEQIKALCQHNDVVLCHVTDPLEHDLATLNKMVLSDGQLQLSVSGQEAQLRDAFAKDVVQAIDDFTAVAKKYRIPVLPFNTVDPTDVQLRKALGAS
ncbi:DUF58 domain-containing protein [Vibrio splendidus]|uniref:DUF58 domain-containing protein n=1 Tax=Vibrio splendidus TaxID=29497 RepID=UPI000C832079|nr:DUF58 domain-containing protein [Vibrio splendidus]MBU2911131.1 DUF58 domain-containing protein [Vibrio splendidus]MDO6529822.1 DUF58 domain-containing protein [Vibrio splendidus]MDO6550877.1 DUF58 domain-containing protein [Vibrio splendidus]PMO42175.1 MoxR protein [Vibrio splendidus]PTQ15435.1 DUF58 domain-containing protein [Vibrio splendidus]